MAMFILHIYLAIVFKILLLCRSNTNVLGHLIAPEKEVLAVEVPRSVPVSSPTGSSNPAKKHSPDPGDQVNDELNSTSGKVTTVTSVDSFKKTLIPPNKQPVTVVADIDSIDLVASNQISNKIGDLSSNTGTKILDILKKKDLTDSKIKLEKNDTVEKNKFHKTNKDNLDQKKTTESSFLPSLDTDNEQPETSDDEKSILGIGAEDEDVISTGKNNPPKSEVSIEKKKKETFDSHVNDGAESSHFFAYFVTVVILCILAYVVFHNKQKIIAIVIEGRAKQMSRRPNSGNYKPLETNVEEMIGKIDTSTVTKKYIY